MTTVENKALITRFVEECLNRKDLSTVDRLVSQDFIEDVPFPGQGPGREGLKYAVGIFTKAFPDLHWMIQEQVAEGDKVASRFIWTGTHRGEFLGIPPTGAKVTVWGMVLDVVRNGMLVQSRIIMDVPALMQQLGVAPK